MPAAPENEIDDLIAAARRAGADAAEVRVSRSENTSVAVRLGKLEAVQREEPESWSLRVWVGARSASLTSIDLSAKSARQALVERTLFMARAAPEDPYGGLAPAEIVRSTTEDDAGALQQFDPTELNAAELEDMARAAEAASLAVKGVTNSGGGRASAGTSRQWHVTSKGLVNRWRRSSFGLSVSAIAEADGAMETDGYGRAALWRADLPSAESIGVEAGGRAVARVGSRKLASIRAPVIFERRIAMMLLGPFLGAVNGARVARGASFLQRRLGECVFTRGLRILDDPAVIRGLGSRLVDSEGVPTQSRALIDDGVLTGWMLSVASARQLGLTPNGYASGPSNLTLAPGTASLSDLMAEAGDGLLVTHMFGPSLNAESGDWSAGVGGVWFQKGQASYPVSEITVAGSLPDFYARLIAGADLKIEGAANSPSLLVDAVAIAGL
jgi:PmbA protein